MKRCSWDHSFELLTTSLPVISHWRMERPSLEQTYWPKVHWEDGAAMAAAAKARMVAANCIFEVRVFEMG